MKCEIEEEYVYNDSGKGRRVTYPEVDALLRTDESYRNREQSVHHVGLSILGNLATEMIESFFIDPMHLVYLGSMKKILNIWVKREEA